MPHTGRDGARMERRVIHSRGGGGLTRGGRPGILGTRIKDLCGRLRRILEMKATRSKEGTKEGISDAFGRASQTIL